MRGRRGELVGGVALALTALLSASATSAASPADSAGTSAVTFFDDFSGSSLDRSNWKVVVTGENFGTVNNEQQAYLDSQVTVYIDHDVAGANGGTLALHPRYRPGFQAPDGRGYDFISGRVSTQDRYEFTYGRYEARIKLPENAGAAGLWPAWWSLGAKIDEGEPWPTNGEADVMENVGEPWTNVSLHGPEYHGDTPIHASQSFPNGDPGGWPRLPRRLVKWRVHLLRRR